MLLKNAHVSSSTSLFQLSDVTACRYTTIKGGTLTSTLISSSNENNDFFLQSTKNETQKLCRKTKLVFNIDALLD